MYEPEQRSELSKEHEALVAAIRSPEVQARMIADGLDPEEQFKKLTAAMDNVLAANEEVEKAVETQLQAGADVADSLFEMFKALRKPVQEYKQANPLDPRLEEWEDFLEAWAEQVPKEPL